MTIKNSFSPFLLLAVVAAIAILVGLPFRTGWSGSLVDILISPVFVESYIGLLVVVAVFRLGHDMLALRREEKHIGAFLEEFEGIRDPDAKAEYLATVIDDTLDAESKPGMRAARMRFASSDFLKSLAFVLRQARATPATDLYDQGILPTEYCMRSFRVGRSYDASETADLVVRIALLGTFIGIIAALTIASGGLNASKGSGANQLGEMQQFMQQLLATAATKFWISAAGLAVAIALRTLDKVFIRKADRLRADIARVVDPLLRSNEFAALFCKPLQASGDPIRDQLRSIAEQIKASAARWVLTVQIGGAGASTGPAVQLQASPALPDRAAASAS